MGISTVRVTTYSSHIPTQQATQRSSPYPLLYFLPTHSCAKETNASRPSIQHMKFNSRVCKAVISYMGLFRTASKNIWGMARCHSWPLPTYPVLPHTSIPVLTADEQQMFHFLSILMTSPNPHRVAMLYIRFPPSSYSMFPYMSISVLTIGS